jgi:uncharacterized protein (DUF58 family)
MPLDDALGHIWRDRFKRPAQPDPAGRATIRARSIYILPSKQGIILAILLMLMLVGSINYGSNLGYLVTFLLGGIWLTSILHTWRNLLGLNIMPHQAPPVFAGQQAGFWLVLQNPGSQDRCGIKVTARTGQGTCIDLPAGESRPVRISVPSRHRGTLELSLVSIHSYYPFGFFHTWSYVRLDMQCLVYPRPADFGGPPVEARYNRSENGDRGVGADDFVGLRGFRNGDSPRHIDWKALARERGLHSKQFGGDRSERLVLDWYQLTDPDREVRLSQLSRYVLLARHRRQRYGLKLPGIEIEPGVDERHMHRCLTALAHFR